MVLVAFGMFTARFALGAIHTLVPGKLPLPSPVPSVSVPPFTLVMPP